MNENIVTVDGKVYEAQVANNQAGIDGMCKGCVASAGSTLCSSLPPCCPAGRKDYKDVIFVFSDKNNKEGKPECQR